MPDCSYDTSCTASAAISFDFCTQHLRTARGLQHARDRIESGALFTHAEVEDEIDKRSAAPLKDYHTSVLEKLDHALAEQVQSYEAAKKMLAALRPDEWRFTDRTGAEQIRMEVGLFERQQRELNRMVERVGKIALSEKLVSLGRSQTELVIRLVMSTLENIGMDALTFDKARAELLQQFQEHANLSARHEADVTTQLNRETAVAIESSGNVRPV